MPGPTTGRERWLEAGQELLREGGTPAVKLERLTALTGLTTGSFYHHYSGMGDYLGALARYYGAEQVEAHLQGLADEDPMARLRGLARLSGDERMRPLDAAMREWASRDEGAADAVRAADRALLEFVTSALTDLGHPGDDARIRAVMLLAVGVARIQPPWRLPDDAYERMLAVVVGSVSP